MEKNKFVNELGNVPSVPSAVFDQVVENSKMKVHYFPYKVVAALFILAVTTAFYLQYESTNEMEMTIAGDMDVETVSYMYDTYSDSYDLLSDL